VAPNSGGVTTVRTSAPTITKQRVEIFRGISKATAGSKQLSMNRIGLNGEVVVDNQAGDFLFIPAGVWHQPMNVSNRPVVAIEARADADDQSNVILAPNQP
jgi:uncharacterized RmlC-like cupin family protein